MRLTVLGSGSRGNALLVEVDGTDGADGTDGPPRSALLIDAGFHLKDLIARAEAAGRSLARMGGIVLTHEHGDHARGAARAATTWGVPVAASRGTLTALGGRLADDVPRLPLSPTRPRMVGGFQVTAFPTAHDARDPVMLVVEDAAGRRLGVAYDVGSPTVALVHACRGLDALVIESNHDEVLLRASRYPPSVRARIAGRGGHLSNTQAAALVAGVTHAALGVVVLAHLSDRCNRPELALAAMETALRPRGFVGRLVVATQDAPSPTIDVGAAPAQLSLALGGKR